MTDMPTPITAQLRTALEDAVVALAQLEKMTAASRNGVNDRDHYRMTQECLDELATSLLAASAASPRQRRGYTGARFDLGSKGSITPLLTEAAQYLMGVMDDAVPDYKLSPYNGSFTRVARGHLAALTGALVSSARHYAIEDLNSVRDLGIEQFLAAADYLAGAADGEPVDDRDAACAAGDED